MKGTESTITTETKVTASYKMRLNYHTVYRCTSSVHNTIPQVLLSLAEYCSVLYHEHDYLNLQSPICTVTFKDLSNNTR